MNLCRQLQLEIQALPGMLGKLFGGIAACIGFAGFVIESSSNYAQLFWTYLLVTICGFWLFIRSSVWLDNKAKQQAETSTSPANPQWQVNFLSWGLLFCLVAIFLLMIFVMVYL